MHRVHQPAHPPGLALVTLNVGGSLLPVYFGSVIPPCVGSAPLGDRSHAQILQSFPHCAGICFTWKPLKEKLTLKNTEDFCVYM